jgi:hypothetical protein
MHLLRRIVERIIFLSLLLGRSRMRYVATLVSSVALTVGMAISIAHAAPMVGTSEGLKIFGSEQQIITKTKARCKKVSVCRRQTSGGRICKWKCKGKKIGPFDPMDP